jgi:hypothetical protein
MKKIIILLFYILLNSVPAEATYDGYPNTYQAAPPIINNQYPVPNYPTPRTHINTSPNYPRTIYEPNNGIYARPNNNYQQEDNRYRVKIRQHY